MVEVNGFGSDVTAELKNVSWGGGHTQHTGHKAMRRTSGAILSEEQKRTTL